MNSDLVAVGNKHNNINGVSIVFQKPSDGTCCHGDERVRSGEMTY